MLISRMTEIEIPGTPLAWKAPFIGTRGAFSPRYQVSKVIRQIIQEQYKGPLIDQAIRADFKFVMPIPKSASKKRQALMITGHIRPEGTPDRGNLLKLAEDLLQGIVISNDSKIVEGDVSKWYGEIPKTIIRIYKV